MSTPNPSPTTHHLGGIVTKSGLSGQGTILGPREIAVIASTGIVDLQNDEVVPDGMTPPRCDVPVFLNHQVDGNNLAIGRAYLRVSGNAVVGTIIFAPEGENDLADQVCRSYKSGTMNAVSISFAPIKAVRRTEGRGTKYLSWVCIELSCCGLGANPQARVVQRQFDAARTERMAKAAAIERTGRQQAARALTRAGLQQTTTPASPPLSKAERQAKAKALTRAGLSSPERRIADMPHGPERYFEERAQHATKSLEAVEQNDWSTNASAAIRRAKAKLAARQNRPVGF